MDKKKKHEQNCKCSDNCTCTDECSCTEDKKCNPDCTCHENKHGEKCNCNSECDCGEECDCTDECNCGEECDCGYHEHEFADRAEEFRAYQKAFDQFEEALEKVDRELTLERARAEKNEHLADSYKKDLERYKERNKDIIRESKLTATIQMAEKILPILDNFNQALKMVKDENVMIGFKMIETGMENILSDMEIVEIKAQGEQFNPEFHEAVNIIKTSDEKLDGKVANVYKKGYKLADNSKVIRHAQVELYKV